MAQLAKICRLEVSSASETQRWDSAVQDFFQSAVWAQQKCSFGWSAEYLRICLELQSGGARAGQEAKAVQQGAEACYAGVLHEEPRLEADILVLSRSVLGFRFSYIPYAPDPGFLASLRAVLSRAEYHEQNPLALVCRMLRERLKSRIYIRFDLNWQNIGWQNTIRQASCSEQPQSTEGAEYLSAVLKSAGLVKAAVDIQPPDTVILEIDATLHSEAELLSGMKPKTRYNIRLAAKRGAQVVQVQRADCEVPAELSKWYQLYRETEERNSISIHSEAYYARLFEISSASVCRLYLASHEGECIAGIIVVTHGKSARYLYGASSNRKRKLMPAYALQWRVIQNLRAEGYASYDLFGIPPSSADSAHPMHGLYRFKTGFGGRQVHSPGSWDLVLSPLYWLYRAAEYIRINYYRQFKKLLKKQLKKLSPSRGI